MIDPLHITGIVLAGGRGARMGGVDKGLQTVNGVPLALHAARRLQAQVGPMLLNANRHLDVYRSFGIPVWPDVLEDFAGPLAGFLIGLEHCRTPYLMTAPCDSPLFPLDLVERLADGLEREGVDIAMPASLEAGGELRRQPAFCLMKTGLLRNSLRSFTDDGGRKIGAWAAQHAMTLVAFNRPGDDRQAFFNANTLAELQGLQQV